MANDKKRLVTEPSSMELLVHTLTLDELIDGARDGLRNHIGELQRRFGPELLRRIGREDSTVTADSILTDVFMRLPAALVGYEEQGKFEAWLWVIARNVLQDRRRQRKRQPEQFPDSDFDVSGGTPTGRTFEQSDVVQRLAACLAPRQREAWLLNMSGYSDQDTAKEMGITANNVAQLLHRARTRLREEAQRLGLKPADILNTGVSRELL
jgi:RNA polymerase sigma-70 factor, ECF subfamily